MKKIILLFALVGLLMPGFAQNSAQKTDDIGRIALSVYLDRNKTKLPSSAYNILQNKMQTLVSQNGLGGTFGQRFIITANCNLLTQDITPTAPPMHAYTLEVTFYVGDAVEGTLFASTSVTSKGVGETPDKAYIAALKAVKSGSPELKDMLNTAKQKIVEYYNSKCDFLLAAAESQYKVEEYDEAIYQLMTIPEVCKECYMKAQDKIAGIYQSKIDKECASLLTSARAAWVPRGSAEDSRESAIMASELLAQVNPNASCHGEALKLMNEIGAKMEALDKRDWEFRLKMEQHAHEENMSIINATKEVAVARAKNQPKTVYKIYWW